jgi:thiol-disulfide isomerase/thioredoxin
MKIQTVISIIIVLLVVGAIWYLESRKTNVGSLDDLEPKEIVTLPDNERKEEKAKKYEVGKEISTPDGFINTDSITVEELIGKKVILVDFWTYSCVNCQRTLPYLNDWHDTYADDGLVILGIHTPEFEFEKKYENVLRAVEKYNIEYPVVLDNDFSTWRSYNNRYWPRKYLIDIDGYIVYDHIGEGAYDETEAKIVELLNEKNRVLGESDIIMEKSDAVGEQVDFSKIKSHETYLGSDRMQYLQNDFGAQCAGTFCEYESLEDLSLGEYSLDGLWRVEKESATVGSKNASIKINFSASKVNLVAGSQTPVQAKILLDGSIIAANQAGYSVDNDGFVTFSEHDLYNLVDLRGSYEEHVLTIEFQEAGVDAFAFTFG